MLLQIIRDDDDDGNDDEDDSGDDYDVMMKNDAVYTDADTFKVLKNGTVKPERDLVLYV